MDIEQQILQIDALIAILGDNPSIARPDVEESVLSQIRQLLEQTREQRTSTASGVWQTYLPYAAKLCQKLSKLEEGWKDDLDFFASENGQFWIDLTTSLLDRGEIEHARSAAANILVATRMMRHDRIAQVDLLLHGLGIALEISDKKLATSLYEEADKLYRKQITGNDVFTGSAWLPKIKKMGQQLTRYQEKLQRYYAYSSAVTVSLEADSAEDLQRVLDYLQQSLTGKVKVTRKVKENEDEHMDSGRFRARLKIILS